MPRGGSVTQKTRPGILPPSLKNDLGGKSKGSYTEHDRETTVDTLREKEGDDDLHFIVTPRDKTTGMIGGVVIA